MICQSVISELPWCVSFCQQEKLKFSVIHVEYSEHYQKWMFDLIEPPSDATAQISVYNNLFTRRSQSDKRPVRVSLIIKENKARSWWFAFQISKICALIIVKPFNFVYILKRSTEKSRKKIKKTTTSTKCNQELKSVCARMLT